MSIVNFIIKGRKDVIKDSMPVDITDKAKIQNAIEGVTLHER